MSSLVYRFPYTILLILFCFTCVSIYGNHHDSISSCTAMLMVKRGTTLKATPQQNLTVGCRVKHCGESLNVSWCKLLNTTKCQQINNAKNVKITKSDKDVEELTSFLTFKWISTHDDGLYRCYLKGYKYELISHPINISVSDINKGVENVDNSADDKSPSVHGDKDLAWLPYFIIFAGIAFLVTTLTAVNFMCFHGWNRILTYNPTKPQEISTLTLPEFSQNSAPSTVLHLFTAGTPTSLMTSGNQPAVAHTADKSQVYAVIDHGKSGMPAREQMTSEVKSPEYATINVS